MATYVGEPVKRVEDPRLITGAARYLADLELPGAGQIASWLASAR